MGLSRSPTAAGRHGSSCASPAVLAAAQEAEAKAALRVQASHPVPPRVPRCGGAAILAGPSQTVCDGVRHGLLSRHILVDGPRRPRVGVPRAAGGRLRRVGDPFEPALRPTPRVGARDPHVAASGPRAQAAALGGRRRDGRAWARAGHHHGTVILGVLTHRSTRVSSRELCERRGEQRGW